jgi:Protein of unknown function (DUF4232)
VRVRLCALLIVGSALAAGCAANVAPTPAPSPSPVLTAGPGSPVGTASPTAAASAAAPAACSAADVSATGGPWGGAAGSRGADVAVTSTSGSPCVLLPRPVVAVLDAAGDVVLEARPVVATGTPMLSAGSSAHFSIMFSNWCSPSPKLPLRPVLALDEGFVEIAGLTLTTVDALPPCNGPGQPPTISATEWRAS